MTFDEMSLQPDQEFDLHVDTTGTLEYSTMWVIYYWNKKCYSNDSFYI